MKTLLSLFAVAFLTSCAGLHEPVKTERATITGKSLEQVRAAAVAFLVGQGWAPKTVDPMLLRFEKESGMAEQFSYNQAGYPAARDRFTLTLLQSGANVEMLGHLVVVHHNDRENSTDRANAQVRFVFACVRAAVLGEPIPEPPKPKPLAPAKTGKGAN